MRAIGLKLLVALAAAILLEGQSVLFKPCFASSRLPPMQKKNKNEVTDYFEQEVKARQELEKSLEQIKVKSQEDIRGSAALDMLGEPGKIRDESENLKGISLPEAEAKGFSIQAKDGELLDRVHINYNDPQVLAHKKDTDEIARASQKLMAKLFDKLKELGIDCRQTRADKEQEPEMYIEVEQQKQKEVIYDKQLCETLRNRYNCSDTLTVQCKTKGVKWGEWQNKEMLVPGGELINYSHDKDLFEVDHTGDRCFEYVLSAGVRRCPFSHLNIPPRLPRPTVVLYMRQFLAAKHNATIDHIDVQMDSRCRGNLFSISGRKYGGRILGSKDYAFSHYLIDYRYRDGTPACLEWQESWSERCNLQ